MLPGRWRGERRPAQGLKMLKTRTSCCFSDGSPVFSGLLLLEWVHRSRTAGYARGSVPVKG